MDTKTIETDAVIILGAGLAGSLQACYLAKRGFKVFVYERRDDMRVAKMSAGRSINLALSERGISAIARVGLKEEIMKIAIPMRGRMMHSIDGKLTFQPYSKDQKTSIYSVSRGELNCKMMDLAERFPNVKIFFNHKCTGFNLRTGEASFRNEATRENFTVKGQTIIAADGAFSAARASMMNVPRFDYSQTYLSHGYKELHIPPGPNGEHKLEKNYLHIWPRGSYMMIALPNMDGSFTCTCFFPFEGTTGFTELEKSDANVEKFFKSQFSDALEIMPTLVSDFRENPTSSLVTVRCFPWSLEGKVCLVGDAAHAVVPFFGQGMNCAFEDVAALDDCLNEFGNNWEKVFHRYERIRKDNADAIADMALENFIEMRDKVADPHFLFRKKVHHFLGNHFPDRFISRYEMVSFSTIPYKEAKRLGDVADQITDELIIGIGEDLEKIDLKKAEKLIHEKLPPLELISHAHL